MQDTLWESRCWILGCTASGSAKPCHCLRTNFLPGDTFWLRAVHRCSSLGSDTGVLWPLYKDGDFSSKSRADVGASPTSCRCAGLGGAGGSGAVVPGLEGPHCLPRGSAVTGSRGQLSVNVGWRQKFLLRKSLWSQSPPSRSGTMNHLLSCPLHPCPGGQQVPLPSLTLCTGGSPKSQVSQGE